ncbi:hypothetical protein AB1Y20_001672 [Prymnesium parvum]|uniref:Uncharacterized protein n=1 Tax=Prymnesium parvum TaxID=97485 RepID=A0AB34K8F2_PRYPA
MALRGRLQEPCTAQFRFCLSWEPDRSPHWETLESTWTDQSQGVLAVHHERCRCFPASGHGAVAAKGSSTEVNVSNIMDSIVNKSVVSAAHMVPGKGLMVDVHHRLGELLGIV